MIAQIPSAPGAAPLSPHHLRDLAKSGLTEAQAIATGHRTVTADEARSATGHALPGLLFTYRNPETGRPYEVLTGKWAKRPYCRLKPDWHQAPKDKRSHYADEDGNLPKYLSPSGCGSRPYFSPLLDWPKVIQKPIPLCLTEGEKKGDAGCAHGLPTIALSGVSAFVDRNDRDEWKGETDGSAWDGDEPEEGESVSRFLPELDVLAWKCRSIGICFDSDLIFKFQIQKSMEGLFAHIRARTGKGFPVLLPNELDGSKNGMDDFIERHGFEAFSMLWDSFRSVQDSAKTMLKFKRAKSGGTQVRGEEAENPDEEGKTLRCFLELREPPNHTKALMAWACLKETWAYRPQIGWYRWAKTNWVIVADKMELDAEIARFFDAQNWQDRNAGQYAYTQDEMARRCIVPEEIWANEIKITFQNGTLNSKTGEFSPHNPKDYCTAILPYDYDPSAQCPHWLKFLDGATGGDWQLQQLMRAWFRWILAPKDRRYKFPVEKSLDLIGRKGSGKGTFLDALTLLLGEDNIASAAPDCFSSPEGLGQMLDKRIALDADVSGYMPGVGNFNKVVSNEAVSVKKLWKDKATVRLGIIVVRSYNDYVAVPASGTEGLDRRLCLIPFRHPPAEPDYELGDKLKDELPGIFAWAWSMPLASAKAIIQWSGSIRAVQDASMERFANDHPEFRYLLDEYPAGAEAIQGFDLYDRYTAWAKRNGHKPCSNTKFGTLMNELQIPHSKSSGGSILYRIPNMRTEFDLVKYLRIAPGDSDQIPKELIQDHAEKTVETPSSPEPASTSAPQITPEGYGGLRRAEKTPEPLAHKAPEGMEGLRPNPFSESSFSGKWQPAGRPISKGEWVEMAGAVTWHQRGSLKIDPKWLLNHHKESAVVPVDALPDWAQGGWRQWEGPWQVLGVAEGAALLKDKGGRSAWIGLENLYTVEEISHG
jgi:putative DNA primase/helicase